MAMRPRLIRHAQHGQVMIETALAAVSLVVFAFLVARIGPWLNASMVARNTSFQGSRLLAGSTDPGRGFSAGGDIHLIGPRAERTSGLPEQLPGPSAHPPVCLAGIPLLVDALAARIQAVAWLKEGTGEIPTSPDKSYHRVFELHSQAVRLVQLANDAWTDKLTIENQLIPAIDADEDRLGVIHGDALVKRIGGINQLDEQIELDDARLDVIHDLLYEDLDGSGPEWRGLEDWLSDLWPQYTHCVTNVLPGDPHNAICEPFANLYVSRRTSRDNLVYERDSDSDGGGPSDIGLQTERNRLWDFLNGDNGVKAKRQDKRDQLATAAGLADKWTFTGQSVINAYDLPSLQGLIDSLSAYHDLPSRYTTAVDARGNHVDHFGHLDDDDEPMTFISQLNSLKAKLQALANAFFTKAGAKVNEANTLVETTLKPHAGNWGIRGLIIKAEHKEEEARKRCSSGGD